MNFGEKLRRLRLEKKLSQKEVAEKLNISLRTYAYYEMNQRRPRTKNKLKEIADFFGKTVEYMQIDDIDQKIEKIEYDIRKESLEQHSVEGIQFHTKFEKNIYDKIIPFLNNFGWDLHQEHHQFDLIATLDSTRIIFDAISPRFSDINLFNRVGQLCYFPKCNYIETYYIIISDQESIVTSVNSNPPNYLSIPIKAYLFNRETKEFPSVEIFKFISTISQ